MVSTNPLEALKFVEHFLSTWEADLKKTHSAYVHAGCSCRHEHSIKKSKEQFKGIKESFDDFLTYCSDARKDVIEADDKLKEARYAEERLNKRHEKEDKRTRIQLRNVDLQKQGRDRFVKHVEKAFKRRDASALARLTAGFGANYRFQLEKRYADQMRERLCNTEEEISNAQTKVKYAEKRWTKAREHELLLDRIEQRSRAGNARLRSSLELEEKRGSKIYQDLYDQETWKVAAHGLKGLICVDCDGWRWNDRKIDLAA